VDKVAIFVDGGYLAKILFPITGSSVFPIDFGKLSEVLAVGQSRLRTYYYNCPPYVAPSPTPEETRRASKAHSFYDALNRLPRFQVRLGRLEFRGNKADGSPIFVQKRVDALLSVDMVQLGLTRQIGKVILLAGDSDFLPAIEAVKAAGVLVELWHGPKDTYHAELWQACDERVQIDSATLHSIQFVPPTPKP
jgi:uncharacterized LabA/DUF88 family protein